MTILTVNCGSTSVKCAWYEQRAGVLERIGVEHFPANKDPHEALRQLAQRLGETARIIAHRIVHGGSKFAHHVIIDPQVMAEVEALGELAPLHNPPALTWVRAAVEQWPQLPQVAVFDTVFFFEMPRVAREYALPAALGLNLGVRRYGFHGLAHQAMWHGWCTRHPQLPQGGRLISLQLGGGCSITALADGQPMDTSMGFSPLEGLVMETRCGDIDASVVEYLQGRLGIAASEVVGRLNRECGLMGLANRADVSDILQDPSAQAHFAFELYCYRARKYLGSYLAVLGGCDGIVFGGGVGEHVPEVRARILQGFEWAGISLDVERNSNARGGTAQVSTATSTITVDVVAVDEEAIMAQAAVELVGA